MADSSLDQHVQSEADVHLQESSSSSTVIDIHAEQADVVSDIVFSDLGCCEAVVTIFQLLRLQQLHRDTPNNR